MEFKKLLIVIPTRNRADLAISAVNSVLNQRNCNFDVLVSDNSTDEQEIVRLSAFCEKLNNDRLRYVRPPQPLPMSEHWDWAIHKGFEFSDASHIIFLTDRMMFKPDALQEIAEIAKAHPNQAVTYSADTIDDFSQPIRIICSQWTGEVFEVSSSYLLRLSSESTKFYTPALPKILNSCMPKDAMLKVKDKFGKVFDSIAPDYNFAYSYLGIFPTTIFYDKPLLICYGLNRSNGHNTMKGIDSKDSTDFYSNLKMNALEVPNSPVKTIRLITNAILHEYLFIKNKLNNNLFPEVNYESYLSALMTDILLLENPELRSQFLKQFYSSVKFKTAGYYGKGLISNYRGKFQIRTMLKKYLSNLSKNPSSQIITFKAFESTTEAVEYLLKHSEKKQPGLAQVGYRIGNAPLLNSDDRVKQL